MKGKNTSKEKHYVKALVLTPTRELASQVAENIEAYSRYLPLKSAVIFGGVGINPQKAAIRKGLDILTATPGRLLDLVNQDCLDLSRVEFFVLATLIAELHRLKNRQNLRPYRTKKSPIRQMFHQESQSRFDK